MGFLITFLVVTVAIADIHAKNLDPGPQVLNNTSKLPAQTSQKRYATKEIILYLTPTQIRALQDGHGLISPPHAPHAESDKYALANAQAHAEALAAQQEHIEHLQKQLAHSETLKAAPVVEPNSDHFVPIIPPPEYRNSDNYAYLNFRPPNNPQIPKPIHLIPEAHEVNPLHEHKGLPSFVLPEHLQQKSLQSHHLKDHLKEQWYRLLDQNRAQLKALAALSQFHLENANEHKKDVLQYAPKYNDHKYALDVEHLIGHNQQLQLEKHHALLQAEAIANSPPVLVHKEINIKHSPVHLIKQVKVPVPTPVLIPVPEPFEVKVPQPYPVPLEIIKPVPVPIVNSHKNLFVNLEKPYYLDHGVPLDIAAHKIGGIPIHSHGWKH